MIWLPALRPCSNIAGGWWLEACGLRLAACGVPELLWPTLDGERGGIQGESDSDLGFVRLAGVTVRSDNDLVC